MQHSEFLHPRAQHGRGPTQVTTTLYDVMAALQTVVEPEEDDLVVAIVTDWFRSGRLRFPRTRPSPP